MGEKNLYYDLDKRIFYLEDEVKEDTIAELSYNFLKIIEADKDSAKKQIDFKPTPIKFYINSCGGLCWDGLGLINIMLTSTTPIHTICNGYAFSMGFLIFISGHERYAYKYSQFMAHQVSAGVSGKKLDMEEYVEYYSSVDLQLDEIILSRTKIPRTLYNKNKLGKKDFFIIGENIEKYKIATIIN